MNAVTKRTLDSLSHSPARSAFIELLAGFASAALLSVATPALAATAPPLNTAAPFGIVTNTFTNTTLGTTVNGDVCYTTAPFVAATSTNPPVVPCTPQILLTDLPNALANLRTQACTPIGAAVDLSLISIGGGTPGVIPPGCYSSTGAMSVGSVLFLSGNGVYIFRPNGALNTAAGSIVTLQNGACAGNVFFTPTATTLGANSSFVGNILDDTSVITLGNLATLSGRALAFGAGGTVTTSRNTITVPSACAGVAPSLTVTKVSNGGVGSFNFTGTNGFGPQTLVTVTSGVGVSGLTQTLAAAGVATTVTESAPPAGFTLASIACSGLGAGGTATPNLAAGTVVLDAAATAVGATITCGFTNTFGIALSGIPTLSEWSMILLASLLAFVGLAAMGKRGRR